MKITGRGRLSATPQYAEMQPYLSDGAKRALKLAEGMFRIPLMGHLLGRHLAVRAKKLILRDLEVLRRRSGAQESDSASRR